MTKKDNGDEIIKVNCSFCGKEIECPANMIDKVEKHACFECFSNPDGNISEGKISKIHVDIPEKDLSDTVAKQAVDKMLRELFPKLWTEHKEELKNMSKQDLAREMFAQGAFIALANAIDTFSEEEPDEIEQGY